LIAVNYLGAAVLFCLGLYTVLTRRNLIKMVMGLSLMESSTYLLFISMAYRARNLGVVAASGHGSCSSGYRSVRSAATRSNTFCS